MSLEINNVDLYLGKKIHSFRVKMRWPLKKLASELGVSIQQIHRYEQGVNKVSASLLYDIAKMFDVSVTCFFEDFEVNNSENPQEKTAFNVVLVEDNSQDSFFVRKALEDFPDKIDIHTIHDGQQALAFFKSISKDRATKLPKPDLILLDLYLPGIKGFELLKAIKKLDTLRDVPVVFLTNSFSNEDVTSSYHLQASGFIRKSFSFDEFKEQIHKTFSYWIKTVTLPQ